MELRRAFEILEIDENASISDIKQRYRDLASIWHPDRHSDNPRRHEIAAEKMKELNAAYDRIRYHLLSKNQVDTDREAESDDERGTIVPCPSCGIKNRVKEYYQTAMARCGNCGGYLFGDADTTEEDDLEERTPCGDAICIGIIGSDGRCNYCGKSFSEGKKESERRERSSEEELRHHAQKQMTRQRWKRGFYISAGIAIAAYFLITYLPSLDEKPEQKKVSPPPPARWSSTRPPIAEKSTKTPPDPTDIVRYDSYFTNEFFHKSNLDKNSMALLQENLLVLGYKPGPADGIVGNKTLVAIKQFTNDFEIEPSATFANDLTLLTTYHATIAIAHPDWCALNKSGELRMWIREQPPTLRKEIEKCLRTRNPRKAIALLNYYKFDKEKPPPLLLPNNGFVKKSFTQGVAPLKIRTKYRDQHHYVKVVNVHTNKVVCTAFIRGGATLSVNVPLGTCELKAAVGKTWYGERFLFGPNTSYSKADKVFDFRVIGNKVHGYEVELFLQAHGNLSTSPISPFDF